MNNTASGLFVAITLLLSHMFLESKTTSLIDSLEIAVGEVPELHHRAADRPGRRTAAPGGAHAANSGRRPRQHLERPARMVLQP